MVHSQGSILSLIRKHFAVLACVFFAFLFLYLSTLPDNHGEGEDSTTYIARVEAGNIKLLFHPNHLLYNSVNRVQYVLWKQLGYTGDPTLPMQALNAVMGTVTLFIICLICLSLGFSRALSVACTAMIGTTYAFWWYSVEAEAYTFPLPFLLGCVLILLSMEREGITPWKNIALGLCFSFTIFAHQQYVLVLPLFILALGDISRRSKDGKLLQHLAILGTVSAVLVGGAYFYIAIYIQELTDLTGIFHWARGHAAEGMWTPWSIKNPIKSTVGILRTFQGLHFLFAWESFHNFISKIFPGKILLEEKFLAETISPFLRWVSLIAFLLVFVAGAYIAKILISLRDPSPEDKPSEYKLFRNFSLIYLLIFTVFNTLWEPTNIEIWISPMIFFVLLIGLRLSRADKPVWLGIGAFTFVLFIANTFGSVIPQLSHDGDYWYKANSYLIKKSTSKDMIVTQGGYISDTYLAIYTDAKIISMRRYMPEELTAIIEGHKQGRILVSSWVLKPLEAVRKSGQLKKFQPKKITEVLAPYMTNHTQLDDNGFQEVWEIKRRLTP